MNSYNNEMDPHSALLWRQKRLPVLLSGHPGGYTDRDFV